MIKGTQPKAQLKFVGNPRKHMPKGLSFELKSYIELVELTGCIIREDNRSAISEIELSILTRLGIAPEKWLTFTMQFTKSFHCDIGKPDNMIEYCEQLKKKRRPNIAILLMRLLCWHCSYVDIAVKQTFNF